MSTRVWEARTGGGLHPDLLAYSETTTEDAPFVIHDLCGSTAHVLGLVKAGLLSPNEAEALVQALRRVAADWEAGSFALDKDLEDAHMNVETRLTAELGDVGRKLHTGRSRNDQVATCIALYARHELAKLATDVLALAESLAVQAKAHTATPWIARTHGLPAQPATLGYLLLGHAHRLQDAAALVLATFDRVGESPLGAGAVGGSSLPLQPAYTASLMGLRPMRSALLATGTRDVVLDATQAASRLGLAVGSLCQDLTDAFIRGEIQLPSGYTTGSSLMPQKRNPDALELARGRTKALLAPAAAVQSIVAGLGLGYQRDFQLTKPYLVQALRDAQSTVQLLTPLVAGMTAGKPPAQWQEPGIIATDVAEALVQAGLPFRTAYRIVAQAYAQVEAGAPFATALGAQDLAPDQLAAARACLNPDPNRRQTRGGPAANSVLASHAEWQTRQAALTAQASAAIQATQIPLNLLNHNVKMLLENA